MKQVSVIILMVLALSILGNPGCSRTVSDSPAGEITIGVLMPISGTYSSNTGPYRISLDQAQEDINSYLETIGSDRRLVLNVVDTGTDPDIALEKLQEFEAGGIRVVIGPYTSAETAAVRDYATDHGILLASPSASAIGISSPDSMLFRLGPIDSLQAEAMAQLLLADGITTVVPMKREDSWGDALVEALRSELEPAGVSVGDPVSYNPEDPDFDRCLGLLDAMVAEAAVGTEPGKVAVYLVALDESTAILAAARDYHALGEAGWYGTDGTALLQSLLEDPNAVQFAAGRSMVSPVFLCDPTVLNRELAELLSPGPDNELRGYAFSSYDAAWLCTLAVLQAGEADPEKLKHAFSRTASSYVGTSGHLFLDENGDRVFAEYGFFVPALTQDGYKWQHEASYEKSMDWSGFYDSPAN